MNPKHIHNVEKLSDSLTSEERLEPINQFSGFVRNTVNVMAGLLATGPLVLDWTGLLTANSKLLTGASSAVAICCAIAIFYSREAFQGRRYYVIGVSLVFAALISMIYLGDALEESRTALGESDDVGDQYGVTLAQHLIHKSGESNELSFYGKAFFFSSYLVFSIGTMLVMVLSFVKQQERINFLTTMAVRLDLKRWKQHVRFLECLDALETRVRSERKKSQEFGGVFDSSADQITEMALNMMKSAGRGVFDVRGEKVMEIHQNFLNNSKQKFLALSQGELDYWDSEKGSRAYLVLTQRKIANSDYIVERIFILAEADLNDRIVFDKWREIWNRQLSHNIRVRAVLEEALSSPEYGKDFDFCIIDDKCVSFWHSIKHLQFYVATNEETVEKYLNRYSNIQRVAIEIKQEDLDKESSEKLKAKIGNAGV